jgi:CubicO group peptidase (beta-lactamase class C family)
MDSDPSDLLESRPHRIGPMTPRLARRMALVGALLAARLPEEAQDTPPRFRAARDSLARLVESGVVPSIALSVTTRDGVVWEAAFGFANREEGIRATPATSYPIASVAKSLTALGALRAVDRGELDLDRPVSAYLGAQTIRVPIGNADSLTTRALLRMTGGIPHVVRFHWTDAPRADVLGASMGHFTAFPPGAQFHYSNASLGIVGEILARVSDQSFDRYMSARLFAPMGLSGSAVRMDALPARTRARTYDGKPLHAVAFTRLDPEAGAGMWASARDLGTIAREAFLVPRSRFFSERARAELTAFGDYPFYSAGWWRDPVRANGLTLLADGAALGHAASLKVLPSEGVAVALLVNSTVDNGFTLGLCDLVLRAAGYDSALVTRPALPPEYVEHPVARDTAWHGRWTGYVETRTQRVPIRVSIDTSGFVGMVDGTDAAQPRPLPATQTNGVLETRVTGALPLEAAAGQPHSLRIKLRRNGALLTGYVLAVARHGDQPFFMLPYFVSLRREP